ncbi:unnamed protein product [Toxocara canis]|uniref:NADH-dependent flavin oxidoreductase n=1 Tax=Toxocara canis TaxID=6265 RepID=A0A183UBX4_TOXCA|nr:unnamed protein product [Toxocara canis]
MFSDGAQAQLSEPMARWESADADPSVLAQRLRFPYACNVVAPNRFMKSAMSEQMTSYEQNDMKKSGIPTRELINLYEKFADGGFSIIITGAIMVNGKDLEAPGNVIIDKDLDSEERRAAFKEWTQTAKKNGSVFLAQLFHPGKKAANLPTKTNFDINSLTQVQINDLVEQYAYAATFAQECGFDGIEISCAYFFALGQFLTDGANTRSDEYGGSLENRSRILFRIIQAIRMRVRRPNSFAIGLKLFSGNFEPGYNEEEFSDFIRHVEKTGFDYIAITGGHYYLLKEMKTSKDSTEKHEHFYQAAVPAIKRNLTRTKLYMNGGFLTLADMCEAINDGWTMGVSLARPVAAEPGLPSKLLKGEVKGAVKSLIDPLDFTTSQQIAGTQLWQHGWFLPVMDASNPEHIEQYKKDLAAYEERKLAAEENNSEPIIGYPKMVLCAEESVEPTVNGFEASASEQPGEDITLDVDASKKSEEEQNEMTEEHIHRVVKKQLDSGDASADLHEKTIEDTVHTIIKKSSGDEHEGIEIIEETIEKVIKTEQVFAEPLHDFSTVDSSEAAQGELKEEAHEAGTEITEAPAVPEQQDSVPYGIDHEAGQDAGEAPVADLGVAEALEAERRVVEEVESKHDAVEEPQAKQDTNEAPPISDEMLHEAAHDKEEKLLDKLEQTAAEAPTSEEPLHEVAHDKDEDNLQKLEHGAVEAPTSEQPLSDAAHDKDENLLDKLEQTAVEAPTSEEPLHEIAHDKDEEDKLEKLEHGALEAPTSEEPLPEVAHDKDEGDLQNLEHGAFKTPTSEEPPHEVANDIKEDELQKLEHGAVEAPTSEQTQGGVAHEKGEDELQKPERGAVESPTSEGPLNGVVDDKAEDKLHKLFDDVAQKVEKLAHDVAQKVEGVQELIEEVAHEEEHDRLHESAANEAAEVTARTHDEVTSDKGHEEPDSYENRTPTCYLVFLKSERTEAEANEQPTADEERPKDKAESATQIIKEPVDISSELGDESKVEGLPDGVEEASVLVKEESLAAEKPTEGEKEAPNGREDEPTHIDETPIEEAHVMKEGGVTEASPGDKPGEMHADEGMPDAEGSKAPTEKEPISEVISGINSENEPIISGVTLDESRPEPEGAVNESNIEPQVIESVAKEDDVKIGGDHLDEVDNTQRSATDIIAETIPPVGTVIEEYAHIVTKVSDEYAPQSDQPTEAHEEFQDVRESFDEKLQPTEQVESEGATGGEASNHVGEMKETDLELEEAVSKISADVTHAALDQVSEDYHDVIHQPPSTTHATLFGSSAANEEPLELDHLERLEHSDELKSTEDSQTPAVAHEDALENQPSQNKHDDTTEEVTKATTTLTSGLTNGAPEQHDVKQHHEPAVSEKKSHGFGFITSALPDSVQSLFSSKKTKVSSPHDEPSGTAEREHTSQGNAIDEAFDKLDEAASEALHEAFDRIAHELPTKEAGAETPVETSKEVIGGLSPEHVPIVSGLVAGDEGSLGASHSNVGEQEVLSEKVDGSVMSKTDDANGSSHSSEYHRETRVVMETRNGKTHGYVFESSHDKKGLDEMDFEFIH